MPSVKLHPQFESFTNTKYDNPIPQLLQTPAGLALIEIQGTINAPTGTSDTYTIENEGVTKLTEVGRLEFPLYNAQDKGEGSWMKKVYLYIGKHQRLVGEVKKLPKAILVLTKSEGKDSPMEAGEEQAQEQERLDITAIIKYKILFANRPEPAGS